MTHCCQRNDQTKIIRLHPGIVCGAVAADLTAFVAFLQNHISFFGIGLCRNGTQNPAAWIRTVAGIHIDMQ